MVLLASPRLSASLSYWEGLCNLAFGLVTFNLSLVFPWKKEWRTVVLVLSYETTKAPFETPDLLLATCDFPLHAWISSPHSYIWKGASPLALQPVEDAGLTLSPSVVHQLWRQVWLSHLQTILQPQGRIVGRLKFIVVFKIKTLNIMTLPFVGFTSQKCPLKFLTCNLLLATCDFPLHAWILPGYNQF